VRLELKIHNVHDVRFDRNTFVENGVLYVNHNELKGLLREDKNLGHIDIELAHPGENSRIIRVCDVVEPRAKGAGSGVDFPGALGPHFPAGSGGTHVLRGICVVITEDITEQVGTKDPWGEIIDMSGPSAEHNIYARTRNIVVTPSPSANAGQRDYRLALKKAALKIASYLGRAALDLEPDEIEVFHLPAFKEEIIPRGLPRVANVFPVFAQQFGALSGDMVLYGRPVDDIVPTILHPNEVLDGAVVSPFRAKGLKTYAIQNHPVINSLYSRHQRDLIFCGVIIALTYNNEEDNLRAAAMIGNLARWTLGADGVIFSKPWGGAAEMTVAQMAKRCEEIGVKTVLAMWQQSIDPSTGIGTIFSFPEIDAIVSLGLPLESIAMPPVGRIIGRTGTMPDIASICGEIVRAPHRICGYMDVLGNSRKRLVLY
jgi:glycine reductase